MVKNKVSGYLKKTCGLADKERGLDVAAGDRVLESRQEDQRMGVCGVHYAGGEGKGGDGNKNPERRARTVSLQPLPASSR